MDAIEFLTERKRLCGSYKGCVGCPFGAAECVVRDMTSEDTCKRIVTAVEKWSKENPRKTRQTELLNMYPEAHVSENGSLYICPASVSSAYRDANGNCKVHRLKCADCRKEFWSKEV